VLAEQFRACRRCEGMNIPGETQAAPGYGSVLSPVVIVGQSLRGPCMQKQEPFFGGSGVLLDRAFRQAGLAKQDLFITNVVHRHPPENRTSSPHEIANCRSYLRSELRSSSTVGHRLGRGCVAKSRGRCLARLLRSIRSRLAAAVATSHLGKTVLQIQLRCVP
jgi:uracil-DNA glycosylase family 4